MKINASDLIDSIWIEKYRPLELKDMAINENALKQIEKFIEQGIIPNLFLCSRPGQGKTSLAKMLAYNYMNADVRYINASEQNNVDIVRGEIADFARTMPSPGKTFKIIILDEVDGFANSKALMILRGLMEEAADNTRFILTANYANKVIEAVRSRCLSIDIKPDIKSVIRRCVYILRNEKVNDFEKSNMSELVSLVKKLYPDVRSIIKVLQSSVDKNNCLKIKDYTVDIDFMDNLLKRILGDHPQEIRDYLISNETVFNSDYYSLLSEFYRYVIDKEDISENVRAKWTLIIADAMSKFSMVVDQELNAAATFFKMYFEAKK